MNQLLFRPTRAGRLITLEIMLGLALVARAGTEVPPRPASTAAPAGVFPIKELTLTNGLRLLMVEDHHCPIVAVQVWYRVGSADEPEGRRGFAHLFEHMMFRGTDRLGPTDHFDLIHRVGGGCNAFTSFDETCYHETLPAQQLELALWLESERMAFLTVDGAGFSTERKVVEEERRMDLNQPYGDMVDQGPPAIFGSHPYGHSPLGNFVDLRQATPATAHAWWTNWYTPNNATMVIVGDVQADDVQKKVRRYFDWIPAVPQAPRAVPVVPRFDATQSIVLKLENAPAPGLGMVWRTVSEGHPDALALELLATILGGGESSRLYRRLVAEDHLAVMAAAVQFGLGRGGVFCAGAALSPIGSDSSRALAALQSELEHLRSGTITPTELEKARNQALSGIVLGAETVEGKAQLIGRAAVVGAGVQELNTRLERLRRLTLDDLQRAAQVYLDPAHAATVTVPSSGLIGQLGRYIFGKRQAEEAAPVAFSPETVLRGRDGVVRPEGLPLRPPLAEGNSPVPAPVVHEQRLTNGLRVLVVPNRDAPEVEVVLALPFGSWAEAKPGAAALALNVVTKGTETHGEKALAEELERYAIHLSGFATHDQSRIAVACLPEQAERALSLMAEVVQRPTFPEGPFQTAIRQSRTELTVSDSDPRSVADREFRRHLFAGHPYGRRVSGEGADLTALRREDLKAFWQQAARPDQAVLVISGALASDHGIAMAERLFGGWKSAGAPPSREPAAPAKPGGNHILLVDWPGAAQTEIRVGGLGLLNRDPEKPIADLVSSYFGGSFGSRLMNKIRVEKGATYGVNGGFAADRFAGTFRVSTFTKTATSAETLQTVLGQVRDLVERPPTAEELALHRRYFLGSAAARYETAGQIANQLAHNLLNDLPLDYMKRSCEMIDSAQASQCDSLIRRIVDPGNLLIVVVGDASRIRKDLESIGPVSPLDRDGKPKEAVQ